MPSSAVSLRLRTSNGSEARALLETPFSSSPPLSAPLSPPPSSPLSLVILCPPHPLLSASTSSHVVRAAAAAMQARNALTLTLTFRRDVLAPAQLLVANAAELDAAITYAAASQPDLPLLLWGYSWGAAVAVTVAASDTRIHSLMLVSPPLRGDWLGTDSPWSAIRNWPGPVLVLVGEKDEFCPASARRAGGWRPAQLWEMPVPGVDHYWAGEAALEAAAEAAAWAASHGGLGGGRGGAASHHGHANGVRAQLRNRGDSATVRGKGGEASVIACSVGQLDASQRHDEEDEALLIGMV